ncbi:hypothetical protein LY90DRAFT_698061 [Neocallimastix californiae]|jgi:hypothetical protein|uniref:Uncharacterized protein n=1 Tax=Neocallimastix californiae TaxID=1754190 RepID=A0A1Y2F6U8_9FUNG|nr:hypothetical protein LY90DRAFT_698061 [Neocallimastix californiae]|eukprot:ORY79613.1 hypothetical protein LY90DRAFT_698061 [Neocallimastix californiae]
MDDDKKPRITSFAFSKEIFNDTTFSSFLFENSDLMNFDLDKKDESSNLKSENVIKSPKMASPSMGSPSMKSPKMTSPKLKAQQQYQYPSSGKVDINYTKESHPLSATVYNSSNDFNTMSSQSSQRSYKYGITSNSYQLNSPVSAPAENQSPYKHSNSNNASNESSETKSYYSIINAIKRENINNINTTSKSLHSAKSSLSNPSSPPLSPPAVNINNQLFYKGATQQSYSAVDLSRPDPYFEDLKGTKSVKDYPMSNSAHSAYVKPRSRSVHNINPSSYEDDSFDYLNDSMTEYSFTQKENYEPSVTTNGSEKKGHSRSLSKSLKRAVSRSSKKSKKGHRKNVSVSEKSNKGYDTLSYSSTGKPNDVNHYQEFNESSLVFKPSSGAISSYGELANANKDNSFDFDSMISSDQTRKISLTPNRMNEIQKHNNSPMSRMKPKSHERENFVPMTVINNTLGRSKGGNRAYNNMNIADDYDSDDSIDRLLNEGKPKKKQETLWEFLKNSDPEDFIGGGKNKQAGRRVQPSVKSNTNGTQAKYIPIKIQYSPFDQIDKNKENNSNSTNNSNNNGSSNVNSSIAMNINGSNGNSTIAMNISGNGNGNGNNSINKFKVNDNTTSNKKPLNNSRSSVNAGLPLQQRNSSKNVKIPNPPPHGGTNRGPVPPLHGVPRSAQNISPMVTPNNNSSTSQAMKIAQSISLLAQTPELASNEEEYVTQAPIQPPVSQVQEQSMRTMEKPRPKPKMVSTGTQYYISDAPLMKRKRVLFRPVDRRNPIAKYMFNHAFVETIYVTNETLKRRRNIPDKVPKDFLARNFYYYARNPSAVPPMPKRPILNWTYPERDANPIAKYIFLVKEGDYPWRDTNPVAKYIFNGWEKKDASSTIINVEYLPELKEEEIKEEEMEIANEVIVDEEVIKVETLADTEDKTEINDEATLTNPVNKSEIEKELRGSGFYTQKEKDEIVNKLFGKIINYLEDKENKEKENKEKESNKTQAFAKLMFDENTKLHKELSKLRSELSAERVLRERAEEELDRYQNLMQSTLLK